MFCYLPGWASYLLMIAGLIALHFHNYNLVKRTEERVHRQRDEMEAWNKLSPKEQAEMIIYGEHDVRPQDLKRPDTP